MTIDDILADVLRAEGGYIDHPSDPGGETNYGITVETARANGYSGPMRDLPRAVALRIYRARYVEAPGFDRVFALSAPIAAELVNTGVNMGPAIASRFLQRALNGLTDERLVVDGQVGNGTVTALSGYLKRRGAEGERRLLALLNAQQGVRYLELTEARPTMRDFLFGWLARVLPC